jgi:hypothetical protein
MNKLLSILTLTAVAIVACPVALFGEASYESDPAYLAIDKALDLKTVHPQVDVNLPRFLLKDALSELSNKMSAEKADFTELIKEIKLIRFLVFETKTNRPALDKAMQKLRAELDAKWTPIVSVREAGENVGIYAMGDPSGESVAGIALLVSDHGDAVIGNIVGRVPLGKVIKLASQMDKFPKDLLKKLQGMANQTNSPSASNGDAESKADNSVEASEAPAKELPPK